MAFQQLLNVANRTNFQSRTVQVAVPAGLTEFTIRMSPQPPTQFNDGGETLTIEIEWSFDGGTTWQPGSGSATIPGNAALTWGKASNTPMWGGAVPTDPAYPTHARASCTQVGSYRFGLEIEVK